MNDKTTKKLLITLVALIVGGLIYFVFISPEDTADAPANPSQSSEQEVTTEPVLNNGTISGSYTYPGEKIPDTLTACAEDANTRQEVACSEKQIKDDERFFYGVGYEINVPAGDYYVYVNDGGRKAYFNGYMAEVTKDSWPEYDESKCQTDYLPAVIGVGSGGISPSITLADWYFDSTCL